MITSSPQLSSLWVCGLGWGEERVERQVGIIRVFGAEGQGRGEFVMGNFCLY